MSSHQRQLRLDLRAGITQQCRVCGSRAPLCTTWLQFLLGLSSGKPQRRRSIMCCAGSAGLNQAPLCVRTVEQNYSHAVRAAAIVVCRGSLLGGPGACWLWISCFTTA